MATPIKPAMKFRAVGTKTTKNHFSIVCEPGDIFVTMYQDHPNNWATMNSSDGKTWSFPTTIEEAKEQGFQLINE